MLDAVSQQMQTETYNEVALIEQAKKDPARFEGIYTHYFDSIYLFIKKRVNDQSIAFDLTQQVFFNALNKLKSYNHRGFPFSSFLYRIAVNECNQHFRNSKRVRFTSIESDSLDLLSHEVPGISEEEESIKKLQKAMQELTEKELLLLELRYFEKRPFKEVAELLGLSESNCKVKMHRVVKKLRKEMNDEK